MSSNAFVQAMDNTINNEESITENGMIGFKTSGSKLVDLNFASGSFRNMDDEEVIVKFINAYGEDPKLAIKWLMYLRDARGGIGERNAFRICFKHLAMVNPAAVKALIPLVQEYGRWDDLWCLFGTSVENDVLDCVKAQLDKDIADMNAGKSITLLAKWLPSCNTSSSKTKAIAKNIRQFLCMNEREYRKTLSKLRGYIDVLEKKLSDSTGEGWSKVNYETVPSKANLIYKNAFLKHDHARRIAYIEALSKGEAKINSSVNFPYDIVSKYLSGSIYHGPASVDNVLEELWKALPDYVNGAQGILPVLDGSGSMFGCGLGNTRIRAVDIANSLGIYFSERMNGFFKNRAITFGAKPRWLDFSKCSTLKEKLDLCLTNQDCSNTNIKATFDLMLEAAKQNNVKQEDMPGSVLIISDGEFDGMTDYSEPDPYVDSHSFMRYGYGADKKAMFNKIQAEWNAAGYKLPKLIFWNVCSRTLTIPVRAKPDLGVALVSGFSTAVAKMVLSQKLDPYEILIEQLNDKRYAPVEEALTAISM